MKFSGKLFYAIVLFLAICCRQSVGQSIEGQPMQSEPSWDSPHDGNPFIPGYYADASVLQLENETFIYATKDPWGQKDLGCWHSSDFTHWSTCTLNWPTKAAATSPTSKPNMVWAPSVVRARDGRFYMYVSVGSEVWVGTAASPTGPWKNALGNKPLIPSTFNEHYHMIDAEVFLDTDGRAYLYWGSGLNWVNGHCFAVRLKPNMVEFEGEPKDVTPGHYFEAPFMYKRGGRYYLMYSEGKTTDDTYNVRYAVGDSPLGPFTEAAKSPILVSDPSKYILGPGHHAVMQRRGKTYIVYHRHSLPFDPDEVKRQLCIDEMRFDAAGEIEKVVPTHIGPELLREHHRDAGVLNATFTASSVLDQIHEASRVNDDNYATRWAPAKDDPAPWLQADFGRVIRPDKMEIRFEYPWRAYDFVVYASRDGKSWRRVQRSDPSSPSGSPVTLANLPAARFLKLSFATPGTTPSIFEWSFYSHSHSE